MPREILYRDGLYALHPMKVGHHYNILLQCTNVQSNVNIYAFVMNMYKYYIFFCIYYIINVSILILNHQVATRECIDALFLDSYYFTIFLSIIIELIFSFFLQIIFHI